MDEPKSLDSDAKSKESPLKAILQYATVLLTLLTALLYVYGRVYYETYFSCWGLPVGVFSLSKEQSVIAGFFRVLVFGIKSLSWLSIITWILVAIMIMTMISCYRPAIKKLRGVVSRLRRSGQSLQEKVEITDKHDRVMTSLALINRAIAIVVALTFFAAFSCIGVANQAKETVQREHKRILAGEAGSTSFDDRAVLYLKNESKSFDLYSGHLIQTSATHVALYHKAVGVSIFPLSNVSRMIIRENKSTVKQ